MNIDRIHSDVGDFQKSICSCTLASAFLVTAFFLFIHEDAVARGLLLGALFSMINFLLMGIPILRTVGYTRYRASFIGFTSVLVRNGVLAVPLLLGIKSNSFSFFAVVVGVFSVQIVLVFKHLLVRPSPHGK